MEMATNFRTLRTTSRWQRALLLSGVAAALGVAVGLGAWRLAPTGHGNTAAQQARPVQEQAGQQAAVTTGHEVAVRTVENPTLVLVGSAEQAQSAEQSIEAANVIRATLGNGPLPQTVQQVTSGSDAATWARTIADENLTRVSLGLAELQVQDLRPESGAVTTGHGVVFSTVEIPTLVLVGSAEQAQAQQRGIDEADVIRRGMGVGPLPYTVQQVTSGANAATWARTIADENLTRVSLGLPEITVADLR
jgi:hypothetical protein